MYPDLQVDTDDLRRIAAALTGTAARVTGAAAPSPPAVPVPRWTTSEAAALAADGARLQLTQVGTELAATADQITAAATAYEAADARAAARLAAARLAAARLAAAPLATPRPPTAPLATAR